MLMKASAESPRMFDSDFIDSFSRTPWWTVPLLWIPGSMAFAAYGVHVTGMSALSALGFFAVGWFCWTLAEYWLHRTVFHWWKDSWFHFLVHGVHHKWHWDKFRLVMPPAVSLILCLLFGSAYYLLMGELMWNFMAGFVFGYMVYDVTHYATHHLKFKGKLFQRLKKHHLLHHHSPKYQDRHFGVSAIWWDKVFRTA